MTSQAPPDGATAQHTDGPSGRFSRTIDWAVTLLLVLGGILFGALGYVVFLAADRDAIARLVADGTVQSDVLTNAELVDATYTLAWWGGLGLAVTGALLAAAGVAFIALRTRSRRRFEATGEQTSETTLNAVVGAVVTTVVSFVPFSPILGGGVAGYLQRGSGLRVGALAGLVAAAPFVVLFAFLVVGLATAGFAIVGVLMVVALALAVGYLVVLSALGGYLGSVLADGREQAA